MFDRVQKPCVQPRDSRQLLSIQSVILRVVLKDQPKLARVGNEDIVAPFLQKLGHPSRMPAHFKGDARGRYSLEPSTHRLRRSRELALLDDLSARV